MLLPTGQRHGPEAPPSSREVLISQPVAPANAPESPRLHSLILGGAKMRTMRKQSLPLEATYGRSASRSNLAHAPCRRAAARLRSRLRPADSRRQPLRLAGLPEVRLM